MDINEKYNRVFEGLEQVVQKRAKKEIYPAFGYTSNLDILCDFRMDILNQLLAKYLPDAKPETIKVPDRIYTIENFLSAVAFFCIHGIGGEVDIEDPSILSKYFATRNGMGGTAVQAAMALSAVHCPSIVHLTDDSKEVCEILDSPYIYTVSSEGELIHTDQVVQTAQQEIHFIMQFKKGDEVQMGTQKIAIPTSNRLIITKITVNETVPFSKPYFAYIEQHADQISSNVLSSFNALQDENLLLERLEYVKKHISKYRENNLHGIVYFEDAHYHNGSIRKLCLETIYPEVDIVSLNEEELKYTLEMYHQPIDSEDILSCTAGCRYIKEHFHIRKGVIVHTKDYSMYVGERLETDIEFGLLCGNLLATSKTISGSYGTKEQIAQVMQLPLSEKGLQNLEIISSAFPQGEVVLVPSKYIDKPKYTIGLGDSFVAGVQICFSGESAGYLY